MRFISTHFHLNGIWLRLTIILLLVQSMIGSSIPDFKGASLSTYSTELSASHFAPCETSLIDPSGKNNTIVWVKTHSPYFTERILGTPASFNFNRHQASFLRPAHLSIIIELRRLRI